MFEEYFLSPRFVLTYLFAKQKSNWITAISVDVFSIIFNYSNILQFKLKIIVSFFKVFKKCYSYIFINIAVKKEMRFILQTVTEFILSLMFLVFLCIILFLFTTLIKTYKNVDIKFIAYVALLVRSKSKYLKSK